jgi:ubiquinone/menaquinone biosynthesis C-methylase UbiE
MISYNQPPKIILRFQEVEINSFLEKGKKTNIDWRTVESFGDEWNKFDNFSNNELDNIGNDYFDIAEKIINKNSVVLEIGCGSGRWMKFLAEKVSFVEGIDPSNSVINASKYLFKHKNTRITQAEVDNIPFDDESFDLVYSLGVLHHLPDTASAIKKCIDKVKPGGYFLVYLYYNLDNRKRMFKFLFYCSNLIRMVVSKLPFQIKSITCDILAVGLYMPFVFLSKGISSIHFLKKYTSLIPLSYYKDKTFNIIRNDSLDRFGTPLEKRFSKIQITEMMQQNGLSEIVFSKKEPYWHAIGIKK